MADGAEESVAGVLNGPGGVEVGGGGGEPVEGFEGDAGPEEAFGAGHRLEAFVGRGDILLPVAPPNAAVGARDLGGEKPLEMAARRAKRSSPYTSYMRCRTTLVAGPESWPKASSTSASRAV